MQRYQIIKGNPLKDEIILVQAFGNSWGGSYLISKETLEYIKIYEGDMSAAEALVDNPPNRAYFLEDLIEKKRQEKRDAVDIDKLAEQRGLKVFRSKYFKGYWNLEHGEFNKLPEEWAILPKGDAVITRRVRKGPYWVLHKQVGKYPELIGTLAPAENIEKALAELGSEEEISKRQQGKVEGQKKREQQITERLRATIVKAFPNIPEDDVNTVLNNSRQSGAVGKAQMVYFGSDAEVLERVAFLAVQAHVRHRYTDYDAILDRLGPDEDARETARRRVRQEIDEKLGEWGYKP